MFRCALEQWVKTHPTLQEGSSQLQKHHAAWTSRRMAVE